MFSDDLCMSVIRTQSPLTNLKRPLIQWLRLRKLVLIIIERRQIVHSLSG